MMKLSLRVLTVVMSFTLVNLGCTSPHVNNIRSSYLDTIPLVNDSLLIREVKSGIVTKEYREINGKKEGLFKKFDKKGKLESWGNYVNDQKAGRWQRADTLDSLHFFITVFEEGRQTGFGYRYLYWKPPHHTRIWNITTTEGDSINRDWGYYETGELGTYTFKNETSGLDSIIGFKKSGDTSDFSIFLKGKLQYINLYDD